MGRSLRGLGIVATLALSGCFLSHGRGGPNPPDAGPDASSDRNDQTMDAGPRDASRPARRDASARDAGTGDAGAPEEIVCENAAEVDLLLVLDDSGSFRPEDGILMDRLSHMLRRLVRPLDMNRDGFEDWPRLQDLHVGIVSTSVAGPAFCASAADGRLRRGTGAPFPSCRRAPYPAYQSYVVGDDPERMVDDTMCVAFGPREGCQVEQPLDAMAKALLPSDAPFWFLAGGPRGDSDNAGFLRPDSVLVVLVFTDEDDCSVRDTSIFNVPDAGRHDPFIDAGPSPGAPGCRAGQWGLHDVQRYRDVLAHVRPGHPERVLFGFVAGIDRAVTTSFGRDLGPCGGNDFPHRLVQLAQELPGRAVGGSNCQLSEITFVQALASRIANTACAD